MRLMEEREIVRRKPPGGALKDECGYHTGMEGGLSGAGWLWQRAVRLWRAGFWAGAAPRGYGFALYPAGAGNPEYGAGE